MLWRRSSSLIRDSGFVSTTASIGFAVLLAISTGFAFFTSAETTAAMTRTGTVETLRNLYGRARFAVVTEEALERMYRLEPGARVARDHAAAAKELTSALETIAIVAPPANAAEARRLLTMQGRYLTGTRRMFAAVDAHDSARVLAMDHALEPIFSAIQARVYARATEEIAAAAAAFDALEITHQSLRRAAFALRLLGLACLLSFLFA